MIIFLILVSNNSTFSFVLVFHFLQVNYFSSVSVSDNPGMHTCTETQSYWHPPSPVSPLRLRLCVIIGGWWRTAPKEMKCSCLRPAWIYGYPKYTCNLMLEHHTHTHTNTRAIACPCMLLFIAVGWVLSLLLRPLHRFNSVNFLTPECDPQVLTSVVISGGPCFSSVFLVTFPWRCLLSHP